MARKRSLWWELQRERERRARAAQARERTQRQMVRQMVQDAERAQRRADRADAAERRRQEQLAHEAGAAAAKEMKAQLDGQVAELRTRHSVRPIMFGASGHAAAEAGFQARLHIRGWVYLPQGPGKVA